MGVEFDKDSSWPPWVGVNSLSSQIELGIHISARTYVTISDNGQTASLKEAMMSINVLIRSGEARLVVWSRKMLYSGFSIFPRSVFWSAYLNGRSDNTDVITPVGLDPVAKRSRQKKEMNGRLYECFPSSSTFCFSDCRT